MLSLLDLELEDVQEKQQEATTQQVPLLPTEADQGHRCFQLDE